MSEPDMSDLTAGLLESIKISASSLLLGSDPARRIRRCPRTRKQEHGDLQRRDLEANPDPHVREALGRISVVRVAL